MAQRDATINLGSALDFGRMGFDPAVQLQTQAPAVQTELRSTDTDVGRVLYTAKVDPETLVQENSAIAPPPDNNPVDSFATLPADLMAALPIVNVPMQRTLPGVVPGTTPPAPDSVLMSAAGIAQALPVAQTVNRTQPTVMAAGVQPMVQMAPVAAMQAPGVQTMVGPGMVQRVEAELPDPLKPETIIGKYEPVFEQPILEVDGLEAYRRNGYGELEIHYVKQSSEGHLIYQTVCVCVSGPTVNPMGEKVNLNVTTEANDLSTIILERDHRGDTWHQVAIKEKVTPAEKIREIIKLVEVTRAVGKQAPAGKLNLKLADLRLPYKVNCAIAGIMMTPIRRAVHVREITTTRRPIMSAANPAYIGLNTAAAGPFGSTFVVQQQPPSPLAIPPGYMLVPQTAVASGAYPTVPVGTAVGATTVYRQ